MSAWLIAAPAALGCLVLVLLARRRVRPRRRLLLVLSGLPLLAALTVATVTLLATPSFAAGTTGGVITQTAAAGTNGSALIAAAIAVAGSSIPCSVTCQWKRSFGTNSSRTPFHIE